MQKIIRHWWKKSKMTQTDGEIFYVLGLEESILWKWLHYPKQSIDSIQSYQIINSIFHRTRMKISQFIWKHKRPQITKGILRKKEWSWRNQSSWFQTILQSYSRQDSMELAQKQKYRPLEQDREPRDKPTKLWVTYFWQRRQEYTLG